MTGLSSAEAEKRLKTNGKNSLAEQKGSGALKIFLFQFKDIMVLILLAATAISVLLGEIYDAVTIMVIVLLNAVLGFVQEYRTEKTLETLKNMTSPTVKVYRDGVLKEISAEELVCGDIVEYDAGDKINADAVLIEAVGVFTDEAVLTGESQSISKRVTDTADTDNSTGKENILYSGTNMLKGHAKACVIATGKNSQMGRISSMLSEIEETETPLQIRLGELGKIVAVLCIVVCIIVFLAGVLRGEPAFDMMLTGITIAIAAIPEGLPATVTIALALAVNRMLKQKALVNKLHSVETLGCSSVICTDKTGTITENKMTVKQVRNCTKMYEISGQGNEIKGCVTVGGNRINPKSDFCLTEIMKCGVLCSNASIHTDGNMNSRDRGNLQAEGEWKTSGDSTETALLIAAAKCGIKSEDLKYECKRIKEIPFDSDIRYMAVIVKNSSGNYTAYMKGSADVIIQRCAFYQNGNTAETFSAKVRRSTETDVAEMSGEALRVIALCRKDITDINAPLDNMTFLGLAGMQDAPRKEAAAAVKMCRSAKIKTVMITGDHPLTAGAVAKQAGILQGREIITGDELDKLSDSELSANLDKYSVYARVNPSHKLRLVKAYKAKGHIVTMTGDGVNDAPAVKEADVGVAMGITGTDVTKQAADVILLDDNFSTLVKAVREGRNIYANIRKFVRYLLSCNIGEVLTMFVGILMGFPVVLLPVQLLLVNLATDGLPAIALSTEPPDSEVMRKPPRKSNESFFSDGLMEKIIFRGIMIGVCTLGCFAVMLNRNATVETARTAALLTLVMSQLLHVFECKSEKGNIFTVKYTNNPKLIYAVFISLIIIMASIYVPYFRKIFSTTFLSLDELLISFGFSFVMPLVNAIKSIKKGHS